MIPGGVRLRGLIVVLWRAGLRISEALALSESDLDASRGAVLVRCGKGGKRREVGMDRWAWQQLEPWLSLRATMPVGSLFCILRGPTRGTAVGAGRGPRPAASSRGSCWGQVAGSLPINCGTRTRWRCRAKASR